MVDEEKQRILDEEYERILQFIAEFSVAFPQSEILTDNWRYAFIIYKADHTPEEDGNVRQSVYQSNDRDTNRITTALEDAKVGLLTAILATEPDTDNSNTPEEAPATGKYDYKKKMN
jgi:hypothetical protein